MVQKKPDNITLSVSATEKMPVLFIGHGSPMNAIEENNFVEGWRGIGATLPEPAAILCISAHWETRGVRVTAMHQPRTIHDFGGFPRELYAVQYPAPGSPELAEAIIDLAGENRITTDFEWGLDHGCWSVLKRIFPDADIPVVQLSLDRTQPAGFHYNLARKLTPLRRKGILILASGNMVHNLALVAWDRVDQRGFGYDWAIEANEKMKSFIRAKDHRSLIGYQSQGKAFDLAIPTPEHFLPLLYALALQEDQDTVEIFNDKALMGSLTMTSLKIK